MLKFIVIYILVVSCTANEDGFFYESDVLVLNDNNFDIVINKFKYLLVDFYAEWY